MLDGVAVQLLGDGKRRKTWLEDCDALLNGLGGSRNFDRNRVWTGRWPPGL